MRNLLLLYCCCIFFACQNTDSSYHLAANEMAWQIGTQTFKPSQTTASVVHHAKGKRLSITALDGSEGLLIVINTPNTTLKDTYSLVKEAGNSIKYNEKEGNLLEVYISESCRPAKGNIIITAHDVDNKTISGYFEATLCTTGRTGKFAQHELNNGKFHQLSYRETHKK